MGKDTKKFRRILQSGAWSLSALALGTMALPAESFAQDRGRWDGGERSQSAQQPVQGSRGERGQNGGWRSRGERAEAHREATGQSWGRRGDNPAPAVPARAERGDRGQVVSQSPGRNRSYADPTRNRSYRDGRRDDTSRAEARRNQTRQNWRDNDNQRRGDWRGRADSDRGDWRNRRDNDRGDWRNRRDNDRGDWSGRRDNHRGDWRERDARRWSHGDARRHWNREWRHDNRYDWHRHRNSNRHVYRLGRYYSPYHGYHYRRLSIGLFLNSLFYSNRYWIDDPWQYRLPPAYGPYKWIRYYDDALLVDIYTGEVVDVIYSFFW